MLKGVRTVMEVEEEILETYIVSTTLYLKGNVMPNVDEINTILIDWAIKHGYTLPVFTEEELTDDEKEDMLPSSIFREVN